MKPEIRVPASFVAAFEAVARAYNLKELGEYDEAKAAARRDIENAEISYAVMAKEFNATSERGENER